MRAKQDRALVIKSIVDGFATDERDAAIARFSAARPGRRRLVPADRRGLTKPTRTSHAPDTLGWPRTEDCKLGPTAACQLSRARGAVGRPIQLPRLERRAAGD
jgi:hypothetical protein